MNKLYKFMLIVFLYAWNVTANATLNLELTQGISSAMPIAVVAFSGEKSNSQVSQTIAADLKNSGQFRIVKNIGNMGFLNSIIQKK